MPKKPREDGVTEGPESEKSKKAGKIRSRLTSALAGVTLLATGVNAYGAYTKSQEGPEKQTITLAQLQKKPLKWRRQHVVFDHKKFGRTPSLDQIMSKEDLNALNNFILSSDLDPELQLEAIREFSNQEKTDWLSDLSKIKTVEGQLLLVGKMPASSSYLKKSLQHALSAEVKKALHNRIKKG